jgi:sugar O-acyltransferase (sialic acid O-acetyltransferase NeuD family)
MPKTQLLIFPFNGNGLEALDALNDEIEFLGFVDDTPEKQGINQYGHRVFDRSAFDQFPDAQVLAVPGSPTSFRLRHQLIAGLNVSENRLATVVHPSAQVSKQARLGKNVLIMAHVVVCGNAVIGDHCVVLPQSVIHHDSSIGDYTLMGSGVVVAGYTRIGKSCYIGSKSSIINQIEIADGTLIGMGSNVIRSISNGAIIAGNPAKSIER